MDVEGKRGRGPEAEAVAHASGHISKMCPLIAGSPPTALHKRSAVGGEPAISSLLSELRNLVHFPILLHESILLSFRVINESTIRFSYYYNS